jgi:4-hydroxybenzoate polyprenyltransferase
MAGRRRGRASRKSSALLVVLLLVFDVALASLLPTRAVVLAVVAVMAIGGWSAVRKVSRPARSGRRRSRA